MLLSKAIALAFMAACAVVSAASINDALLSQAQVGQLGCMHVVEGGSAKVVLK